MKSLLLTIISGLVCQASAQIKAVAQAKLDGIVVCSPIVKRVNGKFRYFFDIRNYGPKPFLGTVEISLLNKMKGVTNGKESFQTSQPIPMNLGQSAYMDAHTGPERFHGDACVAAFSWRVVVDGNQIKTGAGPISAKFEELTPE